MAADQLTRPWGLSRATEQLPAAPYPWSSTKLDPVTQVTIFIDGHGKSLDVFSKEVTRTYPTVSMSKPHDGEKNAPERAHDSPTDKEMD
jgi:putative ATP-grasp target RiPP